MTYKEFIDSKLLVKTNNVLNIDKNELNNILFDYQKDLVVWALKLGKSAIFADTGLGKTFMQLEWARIINEKKNKTNKNSSSTSIFSLNLSSYGN